MRKFFLTSGLAFFLLGTVALSSAEAQRWRRGWYDRGYYYPGYTSSYVVPETVVTVPSTSTYVTTPYVSNYTPDNSTTVVTPGYTYYSTPGYYRPYGGYYYGWRPRGYWRWRY